MLVLSHYHKFRHWLGLTAYPDVGRCSMRDCKRGRAMRWRRNDQPVSLWLRRFVITCGWHMPALGRGRYES